MSGPAFKAMSVEEYLRTEEASPFKREYVGGFVYPLHGATRAQAGASGQHVMLTLNIAAALLKAARTKGCRLYNSDMKLQLESSRVFYYPDVMLVCGSPRPDNYYETAPTLLVEVLSKRTAANDRNGKYTAYTAIPSLQTYLIVEQAERRVYAYRRGSEKWELNELAGQGDIALPSLDLSLSLDEIYFGVLDA